MSSVGSDFRPCAILPTLDNAHTLADVVNGVRRHVPEVIIVDDGSGEVARQVATELATLPGVSVVFRGVNGGKGRAVKDGLARARELGFSHALQIDADGQHDVEQSGALLDAARRNPDALVLATPRFDESAPRARRLGRELTKFWARVETRGAHIEDPMCGFRVYPVERALAVPVRGDRMDFDPEIAVRLVWDGAPVVHVPSRVRYLSTEEGGVSHFRMLRDNALISLMHTRLVCTMLVRWLTGRGARSAPWHHLPERGSTLGIRIVKAISSGLGRGAARALLRFVVLYYALFARGPRRASQSYLKRVGQASGFWAVYRHFLRFAECSLDRWYLLEGDLTPFEFEHDGNQHLFELARARRGAILLGAHLGSFEAGRVMARHEALPIHVLGMFGHRERINRELDRAGDNRESRYIALDPRDPSYLFRVKELIEAGESVAMLGDRRLDERGQLVEFLGGQARFPTGPYALAAALGCPIYFIVALYRSPNRYELHCEPFLERVPKKRDDPQAHARAAQAFARRLEQYCRLAPDNWFNFFDFWEEESEP